MTVQNAAYLLMAIFFGIIGVSASMMVLSTTMGEKDMSKTAVFSGLCWLFSSFWILGWTMWILGQIIDFY